MRVLSIASSLAHGGAETVLVDLALGQREHEHHMAHASTARGHVPHRPFVDRLARAGVRCHDVPLEALSNAGDRRRVLGDFQPDVVLFHWWGRDVLRAWLDDVRDARLDRRPSFVCVLHHAGLAAPAGYDHYVMVTRTQAPQVPSGCRSRLIHNAVDLARFPGPACRRRPSGDMIVGRISRLSADKIPADWVRTAAAYRVPRTRFVIAGDGPLHATLKSEVSALGLEDRFELPGYVPSAQVPKLLDRFDVFCHVTSTAVECHPLALLEALAAGVPIVAEARGGISEVVTHGVNGLLASSPEKIGDHLHALRQNDALRQRLAAGARRTAPTFSLDRQLDAYRGLLDQIGHERRVAAT